MFPRVAAIELLMILPLVPAMVLVRMVHGLSLFSALPLSAVGGRDLAFAVVERLPSFVIVGTGPSFVLRWETPVPVAIGCLTLAAIAFFFRVADGIGTTIV